jgi:hypothetical protein
MSAARPLSAHDHQVRLAALMPELASLRTLLKVPERWSVDLELRCPEDMPDAYGRLHYDYLPNSQFQILLHCSLDEAEARYVLAHELLEAVLAEYGEFCLEQIEARSPKQLTTYLAVRHIHLRNELIEWLLPLILGTPRPSTLLSRPRR